MSNIVWHEKYGFASGKEYINYMTKYYLWSSDPVYIKGLSKSKKKTRAKYLKQLKEQTLPQFQAGIV